MKFLTIAITLIISLNSYAAKKEDPIYREIADLAYDIQSETRYTQASREDLGQAKKLLEDALAILKGHSGPSAGNLTCVSRDDDGRNPYAFAYRNPDDFSSRKITNAVFADQASCQSAKASAVTVGYRVYYCASKDSDGRNPISLYTYEPSQNASQGRQVGVFADQGSCLSSLSKAVVSRTGTMLVCVSKDDDGRNPWTQATVKSDGTIARSNMQYSDITSCLNSLSQ